ncbi:MAG: sensor histidine kinase, partial [Burkholderiales bacterium]
VISVDPHGPAANRLRPGDVVTGMALRTGDVTPIDAITVARSGHPFTSFALVHRFLADQSTMLDSARSGTVWLVLERGERVAIDAAPSRPIRSLPADFWLATSLAAASLVAAFGVLAFRHRLQVVRIFCAGCAGFVGTQATAAVIFGRELLFDPGWGQIAVRVNLGSRLLTYWALVMMLWTYPRQFRSVRASLPIVAAFVLAWLGEVWEWWPRPNLATPLMATLTSLVAAPVLGTWQWRVTRGHALDHSTAKVMVLSFAVPTLLLTLTYQLPRLFGLPPLIESIAALSAINLLMFVGFAIGIARFRLFLLDRWWFEALVWALGGAFVIGLDMLLLWLNASAGLALGLALALAGWAYFPVRQWVWRRFDRGPGPLIERHLPRLVDQLFGSGSRLELATRWRGLVDEVFQPSTATIRGRTTTAPRLEDDGQTLVVPGLEPGESIVLEHAAKGQRLFGTADVDLAVALLALSRRAADARTALDQRQAEREARLREREAMVQDLHDGLGGLASNISLVAAMAQRDDAPPEVKRALGTIENLAAESLSEIRGFMYSLDAHDADWDAVAADLRAYGGKRVEAHGLQFDMSSSIDPASPPPDPLLRLNLPRLCQEAINNTVKHAAASRVRVTLEVTPQQLQLCVADDGRGLPDGIESGGAAKAGVRSRGLGIMRRRAQQLGGTLAFVRDAGTIVRLTVPLPLQSPLPGMPAAPEAG